MSTYTLGLQQWKDILSDLSNPTLPVRKVNNNVLPFAVDQYIRHVSTFIGEMTRYGTSLTYYATRLYAREDLETFTSLMGTMQLDHTLSSYKQLANALIEKDAKGWYHLAVDRDGFWTVGLNGPEINYNSYYDIMLLDGKVIPNVRFSKLSELNKNITEYHDWPFLNLAPNPDRDPDDLTGIYTPLGIFLVRETKGDLIRSEVTITNTMFTSIAPSIDIDEFYKLLLRVFDANHPVIYNYAGDKMSLSNTHMLTALNLIDVGSPLLDLPSELVSQFKTRNPLLVHRYKATIDPEDKGVDGDIITVDVDLLLTNGELVLDGQYMLNTLQCGDLKAIPFSTAETAVFTDSHGNIIDDEDIYGYSLKPA